MFSKKYTDRVRQVTGAIVARTLARTRITATSLTLLSPVLMLGSVWLLASGSFFSAGLLVAFASSFDLLDGALARAKNEVSELGSFLDSTLDRYSEILIFLGLLLYYHRVAPGGIEVILVFAALTGSLLVSYIRARAEALGFNCTVGLLERPERVVLMVAGLLSGWMVPALWALAILTHLTALQRFAHVWAQRRVIKPELKAES
jgi:CDP-diacylglycerol--glycerol-3-phosphate 3-phosphatidyltransferase